MIATTELEELKTQNLPVLVERYTTLRRVSGREFAGPCPRAGCDADTDGFHVGRYDNGAWWWFCRKCHEPVSYTHMPLPTIPLVYISVVPA